MLKSPRTLLVTRNLPPLRGGMERLVHRIATTLAGRGELRIIGPKGCAAFLPADVGVVEVNALSLRHYVLQSICAAWRLSRGAAFDRVVAGSGLAAPFAWLAAKRARRPWALYLHGLDIIAPSRAYQWLWLPFIRRADRVLVNSANTRRLAVSARVPEERIRVVNPGTDVPGVDAAAARRFRDEHHLGEGPLLLSVGRLTPRKGLAEFVERSMPAVLREEPGAVLLVIGADAVDAVAASRDSQRARVEAAAMAAGVHESVRFLPPCNDAMLSAAFAAADVHVFPVLDLPGDVEGFGMVAIEAAARGTPTAGFAAGGVADAIIEGETGRLVPPGEHGALAATVVAMLSQRNDSARRQRCVDANRRFAWPRFDDELLAALDGLP